MRLLTLGEAAQFLRMSRSSLYQRKDIPRYRRPGSRVMLFDQEELEGWLKQGRVVEAKQPTTQPRALMPVLEPDSGLVDISSPRVYHRSARYR
ncbi:MAG: helix-turn-helix domain-containing protein [Nitrospira sp.]|nr:helix-turn-helix domain-containing protein [Nitrospira sp.]